MTKKILIVEDDLATQRLLVDVLEVAGYECHKTNNAEEGIKLATDHIPETIIMDIKLPGMDGLAATDLLRKVPALKDTRIVGMSAHAMPGDLDTMDKHRFDFFLIKPFSYQVLLNYLSAN